MSFINDIPMSRSEEILLSTINGTPYDKDPMSRIEYLLLELKSVIEAGGSASDYAVDIDFSMNSQTFVVTAQLKNKDGDLIGTPKSVDIPLESTVVNGSYNNATKTPTLTLVSGQSVNIPIGDIISGLQAEITAQNPLNADLVNDTNSTTHKFVTASEKAMITENADAICNAESKIILLADEVGGVHTALAGKLDDKTTHTTINGIDVYVSSTQPTGTIAEGSVGIGW